MNGANIDFTGEQGQDFRINLKRIYRATDIIRHGKINCGYDNMRTWEKSQIDTPVFNISADIFGKAAFYFLFDRFQINQPGCDDQQDNQHT